MGRKQKKRRSPGRKNTNKQKRNNAKKTPLAPTPNSATEPNIEEKRSAEGKRDATEISPAAATASSSATKNGNGEEKWCVVGLANLRNTCYFNSVLQLLLSSACLKSCFARDDLKEVMTPSSLTAAMCELFDLTLKNGEKRFQFKPNRALTAIRVAEPLFKSKGQHDAHELLLTLLRHLVEEAGRQEEGDFNWMHEIFGGKLTSKITCKSCGYIKSREEDFLVLSISVLRDDTSCSSVDATPASHALSRDSVLPDVVERNDPEALAHLQPTPDQSSLQNNCLDDSASEVVQNEEESTTNDDMWYALHDLFANAEEEEEEEQLQSDASSNLLDSVTSLYDKEHPETVNNEVFAGRGRRKGKKKERKKANRFEDLDFDIDEPAVVSDARRFQSLEECLQHFFAHESVTWRCAGEYPEKRVSFSDQPEIFVLPSSHESKAGNWKYYPSDDEEDSEDKCENEVTGETSDATTESASANTRKESDLKPCLKKKSREPLPPVPPLNSIKQYFVWKAPKVLCIHLKRFEVLSQRRISKLAHAVRFETKINVGAFVDPNSPSTSSAEYALKAVVCHSGSLSFGHYTAFVSRTVNGEQQWYDAYILLYEASGDDQTCLSETS